MMTANADGSMTRVPPSLFAALHRGLSEDRSAEDAARLAREIGFEIGDDVYRELVDTVERERATPLESLDAGSFWHAVSDYFASTGWGELRHQTLHDGVAALDGRDWVEARDRSGNAPGCHLTTGLLAAVLSQVAGTDLAVLEVECRAAGDDHCRFLFGAREALERVYEKLRDGTVYDTAITELS